MKRLLLWTTALCVIASASFAQVANDADGLYDSTSYVNTDSNTNTTTDSTVNSTNTNTNTSDITSTNTNTNNNTNTSTSTSTNNNTNTNTNNNTNTNTNNSTVNSTATNTNTNTNNSTVNSTSNNTNNSTVNSTSNSTIDQTVNSTSDNTNTNTNTNSNTNNTTVNSTGNNTNTNQNTSDIKQTINTPPPSAIAPTVMLGGNDTCTVSYSAAVQTQILGASGGGTVRDLNCERLKNAKTLYNMGMKVASVALMCQELSVWEAMEMAGTPCPFKGTIGAEAQALWDNDPARKPVAQRGNQDNDAVKKILAGVLFIALLSIGL